MQFFHMTDYSTRLSLRITIIGYQYSAIFFCSKDNFDIIPFITIFDSIWKNDFLNFLKKPLLLWSISESM